MSAATLRAAAAKMRERAEAATAPKHPWAVDMEEDDGVAVRARRGAGPTVVTTIPLGYHERRANAEHIASWHPAVALAVADLLEATASDLDARQRSIHGLLAGIGATGSVAIEPTEIAPEAIALATAYLGTP